MGWKEEVEEIARNEGIVLWDFREILKEIGEALKSEKAYFMDDTLRTIQLYVKAGT